VKGDNGDDSSPDGRDQRDGQPPPPATDRIAATADSTKVVSRNSGGRVPRAR
jgi:hypothetical protein